MDNIEYDHKGLPNDLLTNEIVNTRRLKVTDDPVSKPSMFDIAQGKVAGMKTVFVSARNPAVGSITREDVWAAGGVLVYPTTGEQWEVLSDDVNDTSAGTGARTIKITGLDDSHNVITETVILNGTTPVSTVATNFYRPRSIEVITAGSGSANAGTITCRAVIGSDTRSLMLPDNNISQQCHYTVPAGKTAYCVTILEQINKNEDVNLEYRRTTGDNKIFKLVANSAIYQSSNFYAFQVSNSLSEKSDYKITGLSTNALAAPYIFIELIEVDND